MNRLFRFALVLILLCGSAAALANPPPFSPRAPGIAAEGYVLMDYYSGRVLAEKKMNERMEPASLTKIMTAYAVFYELGRGNINLEDTTRVSEKAWRMPGSRMFIEVGSHVSIKDLLYGLIVQSGNDASVALAEHVAGSEEAFALLMNEHARNLGLQGTHFVNSSGLPAPDHYSTPLDMALLTAALIREYPEFYAWYSVREFTYNNIVQYNRNRLLWRDESVDGVKTGHTQSAGFCLVSSAQRNDMRLISVVMGTQSEAARADETQTLLNFGFRFFETHRLYEAGEPLKTLRVWKGATDTVALGLDQELYITVPRGRYDALDAAIAVERHIEAPVRAGTRYGQVRLTIGGELIAERPLVALSDVAEGGLVQKIIDNVMLLFQGNPVAPAEAAVE